jgi:uncharacterized membrane protein
MKKAMNKYDIMDNLGNILILLGVSIIIVSIIGLTIRSNEREDACTQKGGIMVKSTGWVCIKAERL